MSLRLLAIGPQDVCPPTDGGKEGIHGALAALARRAEISYAYPCAEGGAPSAAAYQALGVRPLALTRTPRETLATVLGATLRGQPYKFAKYASREATRQLHATVAGLAFDAILCFHAHSVGLAERLQRLAGWRLPIIVREHNIEYELVDSYRRSLGPLGRLAAWPFAWLTRREEQALWARADATAFLTDRDLAVAQATSTRGRLLLAPEGVPIPERRSARRPASEPRLLLLLNQRATQSVGNVRQFLREHWPQAAGRPPLHGVSLAVTGVGPERLAELSGLSVDELSALRVQALGFLPSLVETFASTLALVSPTFVGGGIRKKVLEAMAHQLPVIATDLDIDSCSYFRPGENLLRLGTPAEFADDVGRLLAEPGLWQRLSDAGRATVEAHAHWDRFADVIVEEVQRLIDPQQARGDRR